MKVREAGQLGQQRRWSSPCSAFHAPPSGTVILGTRRRAAFTDLQGQVKKIFRSLIPRELCLYYRMQKYYFSMNIF